MGRVKVENEVGQELNIRDFINNKVDERDELNNQIW